MSRLPVPSGVVQSAADGHLAVVRNAAARIARGDRRVEVQIGVVRNGVVQNAPGDHPAADLNAVVQSVVADHLVVVRNAAVQNALDGRPLEGRTAGDENPGVALIAARIS